MHDMAGSPSKTNCENKPADPFQSLLKLIDLQSSDIILSKFTSTSLINSSNSHLSCAQYPALLAHVWWQSLAVRTLANNCFRK